MPNEVKQRKKPQKSCDDTTETSEANGQDNDQKVRATTRLIPGGEKRSSCFDLRSISCVLSLTACAALSWIVLQQNERFSEMEEKFRLLHIKTSPLIAMEEELQNVSKKCESVHRKLESLWAQKGVQSELKGLELEVIQLKDWASGLSEKRSQLQTSIITLREAVRLIEERTSAISKDFTSKVASVRTDLRRMDGLRSELESLLSQVGELEDKTSQVERTMVKRIGDVLANSIDRVSSLRSSSERNSQAIEQLQRQIPELVSADRALSVRLQELESGRAKVIRTVTFASDLKPKIFTIKRDFGAIEPQLSDLSLRIGQLAEDLTKREQEIMELRQTLLNLTAIKRDVGDRKSEIMNTSDVGMDSLT
uniref:IKBKB interacting protein n=1 Tax=Neogobius melanostomus TaxID=47308 RepID=A0A8C6WV93_9GOBI